MNTSIDAKPADHSAIPFDNSYVTLPTTFFARVEPTPVAAPRLVKLNHALCDELGLDATALEKDGAEIFSGNVIPAGADPVAMGYAGHQFGGFVPQLGDGRAILLGEVIDRKGARRDIQLKGAGQTPYSRRGDGRAALGPVLREYIVSEAMRALGIPTTRALAAVTTGQPVYRETMLPGAIFTRVAASHVRVGTFQFLAARGDVEGLKRLTDYVIDRHYPALRGSGNPALALLGAVIERQAYLIARWLHVGFIHGVMNTDNMTISGETIDFGPCAFMDAYDPATVFSSIDQQGRYAYANQPAIGQWNLTRLAEALLPIIDPVEEKSIELAQNTLDAYAPTFQGYWMDGMRRKIGLSSSEDGDLDLAQALLTAMRKGGADYTLTFRRLADCVTGPEADEPLLALFDNSYAIGKWLTEWRLRLDRDPQTPAERRAAMRAENPAFIPRNHRVEQALSAATADDDFSLFEALIDVLSRPYDDQPGFAAYMDPPKPGEEVLRTFCGT